MKVNATEEEIKEIYEFTNVLLGAEDVDVNIKEKEVKILLRKALTKYIRFIDNWQIRNDFGNLIGQSADIDFTRKFVTENFQLAQKVSDWFASMARVGGKTRWKRDYFIVSGKQQIYDLSLVSSVPYRPGERRIHRIMWVAKPEIIGTSGMEPGFLDGGLVTFSLNGLMYGNSMMSYLGNTFDVMLLGQSLELRNKILRSEFFYNISGDIVELTPAPGDYHSAMPQGTKVFYYYFNEIDSLGLEGQDEDHILISNPTQIQTSIVPWADLNSTSKDWLVDFTVALCKYMFGSKLRSIKKIASPGSDYQVEFDYQSLIEESKTEQEALILELEKLLLELDYPKMMENKAKVAQEAARINNYSPRKIFLA
jgi:hypothetical protein